MIIQRWRIGIFVAILFGLLIACEAPRPMIETTNSTGLELFAHAERVPLDQQLPWKPDRISYPGADAHLDPGEQKTIYAHQWPTIENRYPDEKGVLTFVDPDNQIVYQRFYAWAELAAENWKVSLDLATAIAEQDEP